ncbi:MAG TPA: efflux RND transporter permease subunit [Ignavibacteriaceae bacterium]
MALILISFVSLLSIVSIGVIFFLFLYLQLGGFKPALFLLVNFLLALIGGVWSVYFTIGFISIASLVGFISLFGIATRNRIFMISHYQHLLA